MSPQRNVANPSRKRSTTQGSSSIAPHDYMDIDIFVTHDQDRFSSKIVAKWFDEIISEGIVLKGTWGCIKENISLSDWSCNDMDGTAWVWYFYASVTLMHKDSYFDKLWCKARWCSLTNTSSITFLQLLALRSQTTTYTTFLNGHKNHDEIAVILCVPGSYEMRVNGLPVRILRGNFNSLE